MLAPFLAKSDERRQSAAAARGAGRALIAVAAAIEAQAVVLGVGVDVPVVEPWKLKPLRKDLDLVLTGIGKANAAGGVARVLDPARHALVLNVGVAGALPTDGGVAALSSVHIATSCVFADEGLETPEGFQDCGQMGFPLAGEFGRALPTDASVAQVLSALGTAGPIATVSTCSGTDALARRTAERTGAAVEAMEGAAIALVAMRLGTPMAELRVVSNTTGDRSRQRWAMKEALATLERVIRQVAGTRR